MSSCNKTHKLITKTLGSQVTRTWIKLSDGLEETDATVLASLEASITDANCVSEDCDLTKIWSISGTNGVALKQWTDNAIDTGAELPTVSIFVAEDGEGYPAHLNTPDIDTTRATFLQPNIVGVDQHQLDAWIYVPSAARLQDSAGLVETGEIWTGICGGAMTLAESWQAVAPYSAREFANVAAGFHRIRVYINDYSPDNSSFNLQWDVDGDWSNVPAANLFLEEPLIECRDVRICGDEYVELDGTPIVLGELDFTCEPNLCGATSSASSSMSESCWKVRQDVLAIDNAGTAFGGVVQSVTRMVGESNGSKFDIIAPIGAYEFSGTNGNNQTAAIADAMNNLLDDNEVPHSTFYNDVATVSGRYLAWTPIAQACPDFNVTEVQITREDGTTVRNLPIYREEGDLVFLTRRACSGCNGGYEWVDAAGNKVSAPETGCLRPCGETYPEVDPPSDPTCVPLEPTVVCYDTTGDGSADLSTYNVATACNGIIDSVVTYDLATVSASPSDPDAWVEVAVPAGAEVLTCAGATLLSSSTLCDSEGTLHDVRIYSFGGVEYQETYTPGTNDQSTVVGALGGCGALSPITIKTCELDNTAKLQVWNPNFIDIGSTDFTSSAFTEVDDYGLPKHPSAPDIVSYVSIPTMSNATNGSNASTLPENSQLDLYVLPAFGVNALIRVAGSAAEAGTVYIGDSPVNAVKVLEWFESAMNPSGVLAEVSNSCCAGKFIRVYMADSGPNSASITVQWSLNNGDTWATIPDTHISSVKPTCTSEIRWLSEGGVASLEEHQEIGECGCTGSVEPLPEEEPAPPLCGFEKLYTLGANETNGINLEYWGDNAAPHDDATNIFSDWRTHVNGPADGVGTTDIDWVFNDINVASYVGATNQSVDQFLAYAWINIEEDQYLREVNTNSGESIALYQSKCDFAPEPSLATTGNTLGGPDSGLGDLGYYEAGLYFVAFQVADFSASSGIHLQTSVDGVSWASFPINQTYLTKPQWSCRTVKVCDDDTRFELDGTPLTFGENDSLCPIDYCGASGSGAVSTTNTHIIEGCVLVGGATVAGYTIVDDSGVALFAPKPLSDLGFVDCCEESYGSPAGTTLTNDNFQDGNGGSPFNLQIRNTTNTATGWTAVIRDVGYASIPGLVGGAYTLSTSGSGPYTHVFTGTTPLAAFANITITGGTPSPAGVGTAAGNPELYI